MIQYVSDSLLAAAKRRGRIPDQSFTPAELLAIANEELETYLMPLIVSACENYYETYVDFPIQVDPGANTVPTISYRVPSRAVGNALREVYFLNTAGQPVDVPRIDGSDLEQSSWGVILQAQGVTYLNRQNRSDITTMRMVFALTPNALCQAAQAAVVTAISGQTLTLGAVDIPPWPLLDPPEGPAPASMTARTSFDLIKGTPGFEIIAFDQDGVCDGTTLVLTNPVPAGLAVGDYVALARTSPVPQAPTAMWGLLAQSIACNLLSQLGQDDQADKELQKRALIEHQVLPLIQNRVRGAPRSITPRRNIFAASRRW